MTMHELRSHTVGEPRGAAAASGGRGRRRRRRAPRRTAAPGDVQPQPQPPQQPQRGQVPRARHDVVAQVDIESKVRKRSIMFQLHALKPSKVNM